MNDTFNLTDIGFRIAFSVIDYDSFEGRDDTNFVSWTVKLVTMLNLNVIKQIPLKYHKCTDENLNEFYPISSNLKNFYYKITQARSLYCIDEGQELLLKGRDDFESVALYITLNPCTENITAGTCINKTLEETKQYLGKPELITLTNR